MNPSKISKFKFKAAELTFKDIQKYQAALKKAKQDYLENDVDVIVCTKSSSSFGDLNISDTQIVIIDDANMFNEADSLIPIVHNKPEKIVLLGDCAQLLPVIRNPQAKNLGLNKSIFSRYVNKSVKNTCVKTIMLSEQYRMHSSIAEIPSKLFYDGKLSSPMKWQNQPPRLDIWPNKTKACVFCDVIGNEDSKLITTAEAGESSKANIKEAEHAIKIVKYLFIKRVKVEDMAILTQYRAQVQKIKELLDKAVANESDWKDSRINEVCIQTVIKSQGSEWKYVILSCVISQTNSQNENNSFQMGKSLGSVSGPNQFNVSLTRSKDGLIIIG